MTALEYQIEQDQESIVFRHSGQEISLRIADISMVALKDTILMVDDKEFKFEDKDSLLNCYDEINQIIEKYDHEKAEIEDQSALDINTDDWITSDNVDFFVPTPEDSERLNHLDSLIVDKKLKFEDA